MKKILRPIRSDIYKDVADKVNEYLESGDYPKTITYRTRDKEEHTISSKEVADEIKGKIKRGMTKRNVMTQPYSVTKFGMYQQLVDELDDMEANGKKFWTHDNWLVAKLLTELNDRAIVEVVQGARIGQNYLKEVTADLVKGGKFVFYTTPNIGFPVLHYVTKWKATRVETTLGMLNIRQPTNEIHQIKMVNGIAPNYIHSLDATLLMMTLLKLYKDNVTSFHFIHDQYGVLVNQIPKLNKAVREAYVELFRLDPLKQWLSQVYKGFPKDSDSIMINTLDLNKVLESRYIFS